MTSLWFVMPAHGRLRVSEVCMRQLARTCEALAENGVRASAVVVACDENLDVARALGFGTVERDNIFLGRRFNDGFQAACMEGVDYVVPVGSDDWVDASWLADRLPGPDEVRCSRLMSMVSEDGFRLVSLRVGYTGGHGIRVFPRALLERVDCRPAEEFRRRAIDTSILRRLEPLRPRVTYVDSSPFQVVDWKSPCEQLNTFESCARYAEGGQADPFVALADVYPADALAEMASVYDRVEVAA